MSLKVGLDSAGVYWIWRVCDNPKEAKGVSREARETTRAGNSHYATVNRPDVGAVKASGGRIEMRARPNRCLTAAVEI